jgi:repressor LexA
MREIGILNDDLLAVHRQPQADNGQIVVARVDDEVTVKRLQVNGSTALLLPENRDYQPIEIDLSSQDLFIEGIAVGVIRNQGFFHA